MKNKFLPIMSVVAGMILAGCGTKTTSPSETPRSEPASSVTTSETGTSVAPGSTSKSVAPGSSAASSAKPASSSKAGSSVSTATSTSEAPTKTVTFTEIGIVLESEKVYLTLTGTQTNYTAAEFKFGLALSYLAETSSTELAGTYIIGAAELEDSAYNLPVTFDAAGAFTAKFCLSDMAQIVGGTFEIKAGPKGNFVAIGTSLTKTGGNIKDGKFRYDYYGNNQYMAITISELPPISITEASIVKIDDVVYAKIGGALKAGITLDTLNGYDSFVQFQQVGGSWGTTRLSKEGGSGNYHFKYVVEETNAYLLADVTWFSAGANYNTHLNIKEAKQDNCKCESAIQQAYVYNGKQYVVYSNPTANTGDQNEFWVNLGFKVTEAKEGMPEGKQPEAFGVTFNVQHASVYVYNSKDYSVRPAASTTFAYTIGKDTTEYSKDPDKAQVNFEVVPEEGYKFVSGLEEGAAEGKSDIISGTYSNFKDLHLDDKAPTAEGFYRITKVGSDLVVNIKCIKSDGSKTEVSAVKGTSEAGDVTLTWGAKEYETNEIRNINESEDHFNFALQSGADTTDPTDTKRSFVTYYVTLEAAAPNALLAFEAKRSGYAGNTTWFGATGDDQTKAKVVDPENPEQKIDAPYRYAVRINGVDIPFTSDGGKYSTTKVWKVFDIAQFGLIEGQNKIEIEATGGWDVEIYSWRLQLHPADKFGTGTAQEDGATSVKSTCECGKTQIKWDSVNFDTTLSNDIAGSKETPITAQVGKSADNNTGASGVWFNKIWNEKGTAQEGSRLVYKVNASQASAAKLVMNANRNNNSDVIFSAVSSDQTPGYVEDSEGQLVKAEWRWKLFVNDVEVEFTKFAAGTEPHYIKGADGKGANVDATFPCSFPLVNGENKIELRCYGGYGAVLNSLALVY